MHPGSTPLPIPRDARLPRGLRGTRTALFAAGALNAVAGVLYMVTAAVVHTGQGPHATGLRPAALILSGGITLVLAAAGFVLAARFRAGGRGVRLGAVVYGAVLALNGAIGLLAGDAVSVVGIALGAGILIKSLGAEAVTHFNHPTTLTPL
ncbi:hypothetical protein ACN20G_34820 (plasmid) [Streptomyces sp. BI20]|uniref:hypothetical protein n=1 Tax=Streptomyces sp. BI20 TaxID=3403460 RepID=UPI003C71275A